LNEVKRLRAVIQDAAEHHAELFAMWRRTTWQAAADYHLKRRDALQAALTSTENQNDKTSD